MWTPKTKTIPVVIGTFGIIKKGTQKYFDERPGKSSLQEMQKIALRSTGHIPRKILLMYNIQLPPKLDTHLILSGNISY